MMLLKVGLTGGIACGKSTVAEMLSSFGCFVFDADKEVRSLLVKGSPVYKEVLCSFGEKMLTDKGEIDRRKLASLVFSNGEKRRELEEIIHPMVMAREEEWWRELDAIHPEAIAVTDAPLIVEKGLISRYHRLVVVISSPSLQLERLMERGLSKKEAELRMSAQLPLKEKVRYAHYVVENNGDLSELREKVGALYHFLLSELKSMNQ
ncbi:MAG: dephospho-CoA kinase [Acidobacteria bacterium]|nr:dephospho-CoA kinase [Acidobacteriota bacterium]